MRSKAVNLQFNNFQLVTPGASATVKIQNKPNQFPVKRLFCKCLLVLVFLYGFTLAALADALDNWTPGLFNGPVHSGFCLLGLTYGNGLYVAVGLCDDCDTGYVEISGDGTNWTLASPVYPNIVSDLYDVTFANGIFVASGWGGGLWTSTNGVNWALYYQPTSVNLDRVIYGDGLFVSVGDGIFSDGETLTNKNIFTSPDGVNWTARPSGAPPKSADSLSDVAYGAGTFVAVGGGQYFHTSVALFPEGPGLIWTRTASNYPLSGNINFCNGLFFAPAGSGANLVSPDGTTWTMVTNNTATTFGRIIYTNGLYVALAQSGTAIFTSTDGTNWLQRNPNPPANNVFCDAIFGNGRVVVAGYYVPDGFDIPSTFVSDPLVSLGINSGSPPQLNLSGVNALSYGVQYSDSLTPANWQTLTNFMLSNSPSIWTDGTATNSQRYYRAMWP